MPAPARPTRRPTRPRTPVTPSDDGYADDPENAEDAPPRRSATRPARRPAPAEESAPRGRRTPRPRDDEEPARARGRRGGGRDDEDEKKAPPRASRGGWGTFREERAKSSDFADEFKVEYKTTYLVKILDDEPFVVYRLHWLDEMPKGQKKSYVCLEEDCPLCDTLGDTPSVRACFNVVDFVEVVRKGQTEVEPTLKVWIVGSGVAGQLEQLADDPKQGPLSDGYWQVSKSIKGGKAKGPTDYHIAKVKERDLVEDWGTNPLTEEELDGFLAEAYDSEFVRYSRRSELAEIAKDLADDSG